MSKYGIFLKNQAVKDMDSIKKYHASIIADSINKYLSYEPTRVSKSRIKKLLGRRDYDYRLRVGEYRIFYYVDEKTETVYVLRVLHKKDTEKYYREINQ